MIKYLLPVTLALLSSQALAQTPAQPTMTIGEQAQANVKPITDFIAVEANTLRQYETQIKALMEENDRFKKIVDALSVPKPAPVPPAPVAPPPVPPTTAPVTASPAPAAVASPPVPEPSK